MRDFDIEKVIGPLDTSKAVVGGKYHFSDSLDGFQCDEYTTGLLDGVINSNSDYPFINGVEYRYIYPYEEPEKKYVPFTMEDAEMSICVGDKVRVKAWDTLRKQNKRRCSLGILMDNSTVVFNSRMRCYCGKTFKVKSFNSIRITLEDNEGTVGWNFTEAMLVKVEK